MPTKVTSGTHAFEAAAARASQVADFLLSARAPHPTADLAGSSPEWAALSAEYVPGPVAAEYVPWDVALASIPAAEAGPATLAAVEDGPAAVEDGPVTFAAVEDGPAAVEDGPATFAALAPDVLGPHLPPGMAAAWVPRSVVAQFAPADALPRADRGGEG